MEIQTESNNSTMPGDWDENEIQNSNIPLPPEILGKILAHLPQKELVGNRSVSRFWRDTIDEHCTMKVKFKKYDGFLDRKLQLRIRECEVLWLKDRVDYEFFGKPEMPEDAVHDFSYPQTIRSITFSKGITPRHVHRFLAQAKPYLHFLEIDSNYFKLTANNEVNNIFPEPFVFPLIQELRIKQIRDRNWSSGPLNLDILFAHRMPMLKTICFDFHVTNNIYKEFFKFLAVNCQSIKRLDIDIQYVPTNAWEKLPDFSIELLNQVKSLLSRCNFKLQLEYLHLTLSSKYGYAWTEIIKRQKNLIDINVRDAQLCGGIPSSMILPGVESSFATLRKVCLRDILSVGYDGITWVPFNCSVFRNAVNLTELELYRDRNYRVAIPQPGENEGVEIINLGEIPVANLKKLVIYYFFCDSGDLQNLVDNASLLECLVLHDTQAPVDNPMFATTGVHGGIIYSFLEKLNKNSIKVYLINYSNEEENEKLDRIRLYLYRSPYDEPVARLNAFSRDFL